jgi:hypothetical protein
MGNNGSSNRFGTLIAETANGGDGNDHLFGDSGVDILNGENGSDELVGGTGNDFLNGGADDDTVSWSVNDGSDIVDGGSNGTTGDTFIINGNTGTAETWKVFVKAAGSTSITGINSGLNRDSRIIITRQTGNNAANANPGLNDVVAQLINIEELIFNTSLITTGGNTPTSGAGPINVNGDRVILYGNFTGLLNYNTIRVNGGEDGAIVDISQLESDHRIILTGPSAYNSILGPTRPQDIISNESSYDTIIAPNQSENPAKVKLDVTRAAIPAVAHALIIAKVLAAPEPTA